MQKNVSHSIASPAPAARTSPPADSLDPAVADALAWVARGMPDSEIVYDDDAPPTTTADWKDAKTVRVKFSQSK